MQLSLERRPMAVGASVNLQSMCPFAVASVAVRGPYSRKHTAGPRRDVEGRSLVHSCTPSVLVGVAMDIRNFIFCRARVALLGGGGGTSSVSPLLDVVAGNRLYVGVYVIELSTCVWCSPHRCNAELDGTTTVENNAKALRVFCRDVAVRSLHGEVGFIVDADGRFSL